MDLFTETQKNIWYFSIPSINDITTIITLNLYSRNNTTKNKKKDAQKGNFIDFVIYTYQYFFFISSLLETQTKRRGFLVAIEIIMTGDRYSDRVLSLRKKILSFILNFSLVIFVFLLVFVVVVVYYKYITEHFVFLLLLFSFSLFSFKTKTLD